MAITDYPEGNMKESFSFRRQLNSLLFINRDLER